MKKLLLSLLLLTFAQHSIAKRVVIKENKSCTVQKGDTVVWYQSYDNLDFSKFKGATILRQTRMDNKKLWVWEFVAPRNMALGKKG